MVQTTLKKKVRTGGERVWPEEGSMDRVVTGDADIYAENQKWTQQRIRKVHTWTLASSSSLDEISMSSDLSCVGDKTWTSSICTTQSWGKTCPTLYRLCQISRNAHKIWTANAPFLLVHAHAFVVDQSLLRYSCQYLTSRKWRRLATKQKCHTYIAMVRKGRHL